MATIEKIGAFIGGALAVALNITAGTLGVIWDIVAGLFNTMADYFPYILGAAAAYLVYWIAINWQTKVATFLTKSWGNVIKGITFLTKLWAAATKSVFGVLGLVIGAVTVAISLFKLFTKSQNSLEKITSNLSAKINTEQREMNRLFDALKKTQPKSEERKRLLEEMNEKYPGYLDKQALEIANENELEEARKRANDELANSIYLQNLKEKQSEAQKKIQEQEQTLYEKFVKMYGGAEKITPQIQEHINNVLTNLQTEAENMINSGRWKEAVFSDYASHGMVSDVIDKVGELSEGWKTLLGSELRNYVDELLKQVHDIKGLENYGFLKGFSVNNSLENAVNGKTTGGTGNGGNNTPLGNTNEAIATGGTRNTTINISMKNMMEAHFNGTTGENIHGVECNLAEAMYKVLGMAETAV